MLRRRFLMLAAAATLLGGLEAAHHPSLAHAQVSPSEAQAYLETRHEALRSVFAGRATPARAQRISTMVSELLDLEELSRLALRDHWDSRTPEQRAEFVSLLQRLVQGQYENNLERTLNYNVVYDGADVRGEVVTVRCTEANYDHPFGVRVDFSDRLDPTVACFLVAPTTAAPQRPPTGGALLDLVDAASRLLDGAHAVPNVAFLDVVLWNAERLVQCALLVLGSGDGAVVPVSIACVPPPAPEVLEPLTDQRLSDVVTLRLRTDPARSVSAQGRLRSLRPG